MTADRRRACAAALIGLPSMGPRRLARLLSARHPEEVWEQLVAGCHPDGPGDDLTRDAGSVDPDEVAAGYAAAGVVVLLPDDDGYPDRLRHDPGAPAVLFATGRPSCLAGRPAVAIVGTRSATPYGRQMAQELGGDLADAGVVVVSGLAKGIDAAAHTGALRTEVGDPGPAVAVVGTGPDVVYPAATAGLWGEVARKGAIFSEAPLGTQPHPGVFPARNRIIAALADVVVVVECHHQGGSLYTAEAAARRGIPVGAVLGSVKSRASEGTNGLLVDGCTPIRDAADVLVAISLSTAGGSGSHPPTDRLALTAARGLDRQPPSSQPPQLTGSDGVRSKPAEGSPTRQVLDAVESQPTSLETILLRTGLSVGAAAEACDHLVDSGHLRSGGGWWSRS